MCLKQQVNDFLLLVQVYSVVTGASQTKSGHSAQFRTYSGSFLALLIENIEDGLASSLLYPLLCPIKQLCQTQPVHMLCLSLVLPDVIICISSTIPTISRLFLPPACDLCVLDSMHPLKKMTI